MLPFRLLNPNNVAHRGSIISTLYKTIIQKFRTCINHINVSYDKQTIIYTTANTGLKIHEQQAGNNNARKHSKHLECSNRTHPSFSFFFSYTAGLAEDAKETKHGNNISSLYELNPMTIPFHTRTHDTHIIYIYIYISFEHIGRLRKMQIIMVHKTNANIRRKRKKKK